MDSYTIYTDGAARGNPGESASGFIVISKGKIIAKEEIYNSIATNNYAEYNAVSKALEWCLKNIGNAKDAELHFFSDSEVVVKQLNGLYKVKSKTLNAHNLKVKKLAEKFGIVSFSNVRREDKHIIEVDHAINVLLDNISKKAKEAAKKEKY